MIKILTTYAKKGIGAITHGFKTFGKDLVTKSEPDKNWDTERTDAMKTLDIDYTGLKRAELGKGKSNEHLAADLLELEGSSRKLVMNISTLSTSAKIALIAERPEHFEKFFHLIHAKYLEKRKTTRNNWKKKAWTEHAGQVKRLVHKMLDSQSYQLNDLYEIGIRLYYLAKLKLIENEVVN